ncbi:hypothetical protein SDJN03_08357, partial [Cucurbita argyrosperma subsp. sororia]
MGGKKSYKDWRRKKGKLVFKQHQITRYFIPELPEIRHVWAIQMWAHRFDEMHDHETGIQDQKLHKFIPAHLHRFCITPASSLFRSQDCFYIRVHREMGETKEDFKEHGFE